jgi:hypothetical protein
MEIEDETVGEGEIMRRWAREGRPRVGEKGIK